MTLIHSFTSGIFWTFLQQFGTQAISFIVSIILSRLLLPEEFGLIAMLGVFLNLGTSLVNSGLTSSLIRTEILDDDDYSTVFFFNLAGSLIIYATVYFLAPLISNFYKQEILTGLLRVYSLIFIINAFSAVQTTRLIKELDFKKQMQITVPSLIIGSIVGIIMAILNYGVWSLVWSSISQALSAAIQLWYWSKWVPHWVFNSSKFKIHFLYGFKLMLSSILDVIFNNINTIIIGKMFVPAQVGFYNRANSLQMLPVSNVSSIISKVTFPLFSSIQNDDFRLRNIYRRIIQMVVFIVAPTLLFMAALAIPLFKVLFTEKWLPAVPYFQLLSFAGILYPIHSFNLQILKVKGRSDLFLRLEILKKIITAFVIVFSIQYGITGLLYGGIFSSVISFFINTHHTGKSLNYTSWQQIKDLAPIILIAITVGAIVYHFNLLLESLKFNDVMQLMLSSIIGLLTYLALALLFKMNSLRELVLIINKK